MLVTCIVVSSIKGTVKNKELSLYIDSLGLILGYAGCYIHVNVQDTHLHWAYFLSQTMQCYLRLFH